MGRDARRGRQGRAGHGHEHPVLSPEYQLGQAIIPVTASDSLESVLEVVRTSEADEIVLDVDERSLLFISLQHLHRLEETAQDAGVHVAIASTNSKLRNAARVFGIDVVDPRAEPPPQAAPSPDPEFAPDEDVIAYDEAPPPAMAGGNGSASTSPERAEPGAEAVWEAGEGPGPADEDEWPEQAVAPAPPPRLRRPARGAAAGGPLDPYGQPYPAEGEAVEDWSDSGRGPVGRRPRTIRPLIGRRAAPGGLEWDDDDAPGSAHVPHTAEADGFDDLDETDGWEGADTGEEYDAGERPRGPLGRLRGWLAGARAWAEGRYGGTSESPDDEEPDPGAEFPDERDECRRIARRAGDADLDDDDGWGALPGRPTQLPRAQGIAAVPEPEETHQRRPQRRIRPRPLVIARADPIDEPEAPEVPDRGDGWDDSGPVAVAGVEPDANWGDEEDRHDAVAAPERRRGGAVGYLLLGAVLAVLVASVALYFLLASATVTLVARTGSVETQFLVVVGEIDPNSPQGQPTAEQIVSPARRVMAPVSATASAPASGVRTEPDVTAGGSVVLSNASTEAVAVPQGTELTAVDGRTYVTLEGVTVPPSDPYDAAAFGTATVRVAASVRGSGGNADAGVVRGRLPSGIFYNNRAAPIAGGSDRRIPVVTKQDRAAAEVAAEEAARGKGQGAIAATLPPGSTILRDTAGVGNFKVEFSAAEGADGTAVTATVTGQATALIYAQSDVEDRARGEAEQRLAAGVKPGESLVAGSMRVEAPQLVEETPGVRKYRVSGTAQTRASVGGDRERAALADRLAGKGDDEARAILQTLPGVSSFTIAYAPDWFPQRMPWRASRIEVRLAD